MICEKFTECIQNVVNEVDSCRKATKCIDFFDNRSNPACKESGKVYIITNPQRKYKFLSYHIDGGVITEDKEMPPEMAKCDYAFFVSDDDEPRAILIELKGKSTNYAIEQISNTLRIFKKTLTQYKHVYGRIVNTQGIPKMQIDPDFVELNKTLRRMGGNLKSSERIFQEEYSNLG